MTLIDFLKNINKKRKKHRNKIKIRSAIDLITNNSVLQNHSIFFSTNNDLSKLCELYGTDKGCVNFDKEKPYKWKPHSYSTFYDSLFFHCKDNIKLVFECGIGTDNLDVKSNMTANGKPGASLRVWRDYFENAQIIGADIDKRILFEDKRIKTYEVDQLETSSIEKMWSNINLKDFDLIIDDGLHTLEAGISLFFNSFERLRYGGIYIIEDVDFSYLEELKNKINKFNPEVVILKNTLPDEFSSTKVQSDNNLIVIRKV